VSEARSRSTPTITVCVPTAGRSATLLLETIASIRHQEFDDYEVLLLDNASPPDARAAIAEYAAADQRVEVLRTTQRIEMFDNFERGVKAARGRYVSFFHDDDVYGARFLSDHVHLLDANASVAFSGSNCTVVDAEGRLIGDRGLIRNTAVWGGWRYIEAVFDLGNNMFPMQSSVFRRDALPPRMFASAKGVHYTDFFMFMRLAEEHDVGLISGRLMKMRSHDEQASRQLGVDQSLDLRTNLFYGYCDELLERRPARIAEIAGLRRRVALARRSAALWMWLFAKDDSQAAESRVAFAKCGTNRWLGYTLAAADRLGVWRSIVRRAGVQRRLRAAAYAIVARSPR
jgi:glycosyltransferase involved in cell wall biosynthesis